MSLNEYVSCNSLRVNIFRCTLEKRNGRLSIFRCMHTKIVFSDNQVELKKQMMINEERRANEKSKMSVVEKRFNLKGLEEANMLVTF